MSTRGSSSSWLPTESTEEKLLTEHLDEMRSAKLRIVAVSESKFKDPRTDGVVFGYVMPTTPTELLERLVDNAVDHIHLIATRSDVNERLAFATREISDLNQIGAALSAELLTEAIRVNCVAPGAVDTDMLRKAAPVVKV